MAGDDSSGDALLRVRDDLWIPVREVAWRFAPSGGPGGQHANRAATRVEARFDVAASPSLDDAQRTRLLARLGPEVRVVVDETRSQRRNRDLALQRLAERLAAGLRTERPRRATRPGRAATARRLDAKRRRGSVKQQRQRPRPED